MRNAKFVIAWMLALSGICFASKEMDQLQTDVKEIQRQMAALTQSIKDVTMQMANIQAKLQEQIGGMQKNSADIGIKVDDLAQRIQVLTEKFQDANSQLDKISDRMAQPQVPAVVMPGVTSPAVPGSGPATTAPVTTTPPSGATAGAPASSLPPPEQIYNTAYTDYIKGNFDLAISGFKQYLASYPATQLSDNAQYWIGECYYSQKRYDLAVEEFNKAVASYPQGDKLPSAMLKKGYALLELYRTSDAVNALQALIDKYPLSDEARIAKQRLQDLGLKPR